MNNQIIAF